MDEAKRDKRPCAVIGPDRVRAQADISPRRTFQENMSRVVLPSPSASAAASASASASSCALDPYANYSPYTYSPYPYYAPRPAPSPYYRADVRYCEGPALVSQQHSYPRATPQYEDRRYHPAYAPAPNPEAYYPKPTYYEAPQPQHTQPVYPRCDYVHPCVDQYRPAPQTYPERQYYQLQYARPSPPARQVAPAPPPTARAYPAKVAYNPYYVEPQLNPTPPQTNYPYVSCEYAEAARRQTEYLRPRHVEPSREWEASRRRYPTYPAAQPVDRRAPAPCVYYQESVIRRPTVDYVRPGAPLPEPKPKIDEPPAMNLKRFVEMWDDYEDFDEPKPENVCLPEPSVYRPIHQIRPKEPINIQNIQILEAPKAKLLQKDNRYFVDELIDVEAKISQSVIHKEVGCNFEIKPCSPTRKSEASPKITNQTKSPYQNKNILTYSEAISQQERKISKRSRYEYNPKINTKYKEKNIESPNVQLNVKFPNMTVSSDESVNYILNVADNNNFEVVDKSGLQMEYYDTRAQEAVLNYSFSSNPKIESNFIADACDKVDNSFTFDLPILKEPVVAVKLPDMEQIIDMRKEKIDRDDNVPLNLPLDDPTDLNEGLLGKDHSEYMDCLEDVRIVNDLPILSDDGDIERESIFCSTVFENPTKQNDPIESIDINDNESVIKLNEAYLSEQKESIASEDTSVIEFSMQILDDGNGEEIYGIENIPEKSQSLSPNYNKSGEEIVFNTEDVLEKSQSPLHIYNKTDICGIEDIPEKSLSPPHIYNKSNVCEIEDIPDNCQSSPHIYNKSDVCEIKDIPETGQTSPHIYNTSNVCEIEDIPENCQSSPHIYNESNVCEIEDIPENCKSSPQIYTEDIPENGQSPSHIYMKSDKEYLCEVVDIPENDQSPSPTIDKSGEEDINIFLDAEIEAVVVPSDEITSKSELLESTDSCSDLSPPKPYKSDDTDEVPNFDDDNFKSLSLKLISDDENDEYNTYSESVNKKYASYLSDDSSSDDNNYKNYKSVMLCGEKNLDTSTGEESMSPYYKDKTEQSTNLDLNGLEVGGCWIDDIACVETVVSEDNEALEAQNSPALWNNFTTNYDRPSFLDHNSGNDDELFKDTNGNVIDQFKYKYSADSEDNRLLSPWESDDGDDKYASLKSPIVSEESSNRKSEKEDDKPYWETPPKLKSYSRKRHVDDGPHKSIKKMCIESSNESIKTEAPIQIKTKGAQKYIPPIDINSQNLKCHLPLPKDKLLQLKKSKETSAESCSSSDDRIIRNRMVLPKKPIKPLFEDVLKKIDETNRSIIKMKLKKTKTRLIPKMIIKKDDKGSHYASVPKHRDSKSRDGGRWQPKVRLRRSACIEDMVKNSYD